MIKLIAFDWNGTLLDDTRIVAEATNITRRSFGYPPISFKRFRETYIIPVVDFWLATGGKKEDMATEHNIYHPAYEKLLANRNIKLKKGAKELLLWLQKNSIKTIIYSNHTEREIIYQLKRFKIRQYIGKVLARKGIEDQAHLHKRGKEAKLLDYIKSHKFKRTENQLPRGKPTGYDRRLALGGE